MLAEGDWAMDAKLDSAVVLPLAVIEEKAMLFAFVKQKEIFGIPCPNTPTTPYKELS